MLKRVTGKLLDVLVTTDNYYRLESATLVSVDPIYFSCMKAEYFQSALIDTLHVWRQMAHKSRSI
jgi:hypothetical protein